MGLPDNFKAAGLLETKAAGALPPINGPAAVLSGSCSEATQAQVAAMKQNHEFFAIDPAAIASGEDVARAVMDWASSRLGPSPILVYSTSPPDAVRAVQKEHGREEAGAMIEHEMGKIARGLVDAGVRRLVVAGGETSGAAVGALGIRSLLIGPEIDPGVPWTVSLDEPRLALALKSGNFGTTNFFTKAFGALP